MLRRCQCSLAQILAGLAAIQVVCAAAAGALGELLQLLTLAALALAAAAVLHLLGEGLIEAAIDGLATAAEKLPLDVRQPLLCPGRFRRF